MFTGIIEELGKLNNTVKKGEGLEFVFETTEDFLKEVKIGDSIAINGACQTVTKMTGSSFRVFTSLQSLEITNLSLLKPNSQVNLEKALRLNSGIDGHLVSGHIDGMGQVESLKRQQEGYLLTVKLSDDLLETVVKKGSIAIDGISLTIYDLVGSLITVSVIPLTFEETTLKFLKKGSKVNIETDLLGKYVISFLKKGLMGENKNSKISLEFLKNNGFA